MTESLLSVLDALIWLSWAAVIVAVVTLLAIVFLAFDVSRDERARGRLEELALVLGVSRVRDRHVLGLTVLVVGGLYMAIGRAPGLFFGWFLDEMRHHRDDWWPRKRKP